MNDHPFYDVAAQAKAKVLEGYTVFQKFTCCRCGSRQTIGEANQFFIEGRCEECGAVTNILATGCNYTAMIGVPILHG